ncbi:MAG: DUF4215 domain-containing protein [Nannocystaceae bacterium]|nr:DUF4215 domain-containing protein [Myxococcales bacterium]
MASADRSLRVMALTLAVASGLVACIPDIDETTDAPDTDTDDTTAGPDPTTLTTTSTTDVDPTDSTDTHEPSLCGNGAVDPGEACDDGDDDDTDDCTSLCKRATCGDGFVWAEHEACDDGDDDDHDDCTSACELPICGDGIVHPELGEECDDGDMDDTDECVGLCRVAVCGDGFVHAGAEACDGGGETTTCDADCTAAGCGDGYVNKTAGEQCDDGDADNSDACPTTCESAVCGDGYVYVGNEECDDGNKVDGDGCTAKCEGEVRTVFVTSVAYDGAFGGLDGADAICQRHAQQADLGGLYRAWLSTADEGPQTRFTHAQFAYALVDGTEIALDWDDLTDGGLIAPIQMTELGGPPPIGMTLCGGGGASTVWSNTNPDGEPTGVDACAGYSSQAGPGSWGLTSEKSVFWTAWCSGGSCGWTSPLYCFQQ